MLSAQLAVPTALLPRRAEIEFESPKQETTMSWHR
jgi:hypothetical protein